MEHTRTTRKQGRRHDALRRTLRRQGVVPKELGVVVGPMEEVVAYEQMGGARSDTVTLQTLQTAFKETGIQVDGTEFAFLAEDDWFTKPDAARNYMTLIGKQDAFFQLAIQQVCKNLGLEEGADDAVVLGKTITQSNIDVRKNLNTITSCINLVVLDNFVNNCGAANKNKLISTVYKDKNIPIIDKYCKDCSVALQVGQEGFAKKEDIYNITNLILYPSTLTNTTILAVATILNTLKKDENTQRLINTEITADITMNHYAKLYLIQKYKSYIETVARQLTAQEQLDSFFLWGCSISLSIWDTFLIEMLEGIRKKITFTDADLSQPQQGNHAISATDFDAMKRFGRITAVVFLNQDKPVKDILSMFAGKDPINPVSSAATTRTTTTAQAAAAQAVNQADVMTGMLPSNTWDQPLFPIAAPAEGAAVSSSLAAPVEQNPLTFGHLLKRLSVTELHYLIHLVHVLKEQPESGGGPGGGLGGSASPSGGAGM